MALEERYRSKLDAADRSFQIDNDNRSNNKQWRRGGAEKPKLARTACRLLLINTPVAVFLWYILSTSFHRPESTVHPNDAGLRTLLRKAYWPLPHDAPKIQRDAHRAQQNFCRSIYKQYRGLPEEIQLKWSPENDGFLIHRPKEEIKEAVKSKDPAMMEGWAALRHIVDIDPLDPHSPSYSMYIYDRRFGTSDIVSDFLESNKNWESIEAFTHAGQLDTLARKLQVPRSDIYFVDIGANVGAFSMAIANAGFSVIALEAMKVNQYAMQLTLCANVGLAPHITLFPVALGKENEQCTLYSAEYNALDGTIRCGKSKATKGMVKRQQVDIARLDDVLKEWIPLLQGKVGALKMDAEGFEPWIIEGAAEFFTQVKPTFIQLEISQMTIDATNTSIAAFLGRMQSFGYELRWTPFSRPARPEDVRVSPRDNPKNMYLVAIDDDMNNKSE